MNAIPARPNSGPTASTSWLPARPTTATIFEFDVNCWVTVVACAGFSWVSPWTSEIFVLLAALSINRASCAKCSCSCPSTATGPVIGPSNPIDATHVLAAVVALGAAARAATAAATRRGERAERRRCDDHDSLHGYGPPFSGCFTALQSSDFRPGWPTWAGGPPSELAQSAAGIHVRSTTRNARLKGDLGAGQRRARPCSPSPVRPDHGRKRGQRLECRRRYGARCG